MSNYGHVFASLLEQVRSGRPCALCVVVGRLGSSPQLPGAAMLLQADGRTIGTLGGGCIEAEARRQALQLLGWDPQTQKNAFGGPSGPASVISFELDHDYGWDDALICGGRMDIAVLPVDGPAAAAPFQAALDELGAGKPAVLPLRVEQQGRRVEYRLTACPPPRLLIAGAGHIGVAVAQLAGAIDFRAVVFDDRADLLTRERLPPPIEVQAGDIAERLRQWPIDPATYVVIVTRGHRHDEQALRAVIDSPARYVGMIGSRRKVRLVFEDLVELGVDRARLERVHSPIGLGIGAVTPEEIAVSILGELIQVRRSDAAAAIQGPLEVPAS